MSSSDSGPDGDDVGPQPLTVPMYRPVGNSASTTSQNQAGPSANACKCRQSACRQLAVTTCSHHASARPSSSGTTTIQHPPGLQAQGLQAFSAYLFAIFSRGQPGECDSTPPTCPRSSTASVANQRSATLGCELNSCVGLYLHTCRAIA